MRLRQVEGALHANPQAGDSEACLLDVHVAGRGDDEIAHSGGPSTAWRGTGRDGQLVAAHGATIAVESAGEGQGATFVIDLPAADASPARPADR